MLKLMGLNDLSAIEFWTVLLAGTALVLIVGWVIDMLAEHVGFGIFGNAVVCAMAIIVGLIVFRHYLGELTMQRLPSIIGVITASVVVHMFTLIFLRRTLRL